MLRVLGSAVRHRAAGAKKAGSPEPGHPRAPQRGATAVVVALLLVALCAFMALVINSGHLMSVRGQLQNATDAAALAGVRELDGTEAGVERAKTVAANYALQHNTDKVPVEINWSTDVEVGHWDLGAPRESAFTPLADMTPAALAEANAVLVRAGREESRDTAVTVTMGGLLGQDKADVRASSVAVMGGPSRPQCVYMPLAFSSCAIKNDDDGTLKCDATLTFNSDGADNMGFTNLSADPAVNPDVMKQILNGSCPKVAVGDPISVQNGADLAPLITPFEKYLNTPELAPVVDVPVPDCKFVSGGDPPKVLGFVTITITKVNPPPVKSIEISIDCTKSPVETLGGGGSFGTIATQPLLVR